MKYLIAGSNGMIGSAVTRHLIECGYEVIRLVGIHPTLVKSGGTLTPPEKLIKPVWMASTVSSIWPRCHGQYVER